MISSISLLCGVFVLVTILHCLCCVSTILQLVALIDKFSFQIYIVCVEKEEHYEYVHGEISLAKVKAVLTLV
ncbi:hypothetical protein E1A91_D07G049300v1 [Gossypium mustelinum]|uniref:Uncharacterized protein n=1 Tax=Gossypium mustelinum TaxID=34275 RepID=A0A5D2U6M5_GOSMU|nr:hypothetical protein E1A91_D07G049300v1 [Gossypium mustelinum]